MVQYAKLSYIHFHESKIKLLIDRKIAEKLRLCTYKNTHISAVYCRRVPKLAFINANIPMQIKYKKMSSFKSSENIQKKEYGSDRSVPDNQSSSVTLNELAMKARRYGGHSRISDND